jgi:hypothetical protein
MGPGGLLLVSTLREHFSVPHISKQRARGSSIAYGVLLYLAEDTVSFMLERSLGADNMH